MGRSVASHIGDVREELGFVFHKIAHGGLGAAMGAALSRDDPLQGALSGAFGAAVAETIAEVLTPVREELNEKRFKLYDEKKDAQKEALGRHLTLEEDKKLRDQVEFELTGHIQLKTQLATAFAASLVGLNPELSNTTAQNALENNWVNFVLTAGAIAWSAYDALKTYNQLIEEGKTSDQAASAAEHLD